MNKTNQETLQTNSPGYRKVNQLKTQRLLSNQLKEFSEVADAVIVISPDSTIVYIDRKAEALFGVSKVDTIGKNLDVLLPGYKKGSHQKDVDSFAQGTSDQKEMSLNRRIAIQTTKGEQAFSFILAKVRVDSKQYFAAALTKPDDQNQQNTIQAIRDDFSQRVKKQALRSYFVSKVFRRLFAMVVLTTLALGGSIISAVIAYQQLSGNLRSREVKKLISIRESRLQEIADLYDTKKSSIFLLTRDNSQDTVITTLEKLKDRIRDDLSVPSTAQNRQILSKYYSNKGLSYSPPEDRLAVAIQLSSLKNKEGAFLNTKNNDFQSDITTLDKYLQDALELNNFAEIMLLNRGGRMLYSTDKTTVLTGVNVFAGDWKIDSIANTCARANTQKALLFRSANADGREKIIKNTVGISDVFKDYSINNKSSQILCSPIYSDNKLAGYLLGRVDLKILDGIINVEPLKERYNFSSTLNITVVGSDLRLRSESNVVTKLGYEKFIDNYAPQLGQIAINNIQREKTARLNVVNNSMTAEEALTGKAGVATTSNYLNKEVLSVYSPLFIGDLKWGILTEVDETEINEPLVGTSYTIIIVIGIFAALYVYAISWVTSSLD